MLTVSNFTFANRSHVKYEFTDTKKLIKKVAIIETSSICRPQFANCLLCEGHFRVELGLAKVVGFTAFKLLKLLISLEKSASCPFHCGETACVVHFT